jgi:hypothetical protein
MIALIWKWAISLLVWLSADKASLDAEPPRCAAAVAVARGTLLGAINPRDGVESVASIPTPAFNAHAAECKQCRNRNPAGPGVCDEGRAAYAKDVKSSTCVSGTCKGKQ